MEKRPIPTGANSYFSCLPMLNFPRSPRVSDFPLTRGTWSPVQENSTQKMSRLFAGMLLVCWNRKCIIQQHTNAWYGHLMHATWVRAPSLKTDSVRDTSVHAELVQRWLTATASFSLPPEKCSLFYAPLYWKGTGCWSCITSVLLFHLYHSLNNFCCCTFKASILRAVEYFCQSTKPCLKSTNSSQAYEGRKKRSVIMQKWILHLLCSSRKRRWPNSLPIFTTDLDDGSEHTFKIPNLKKLIG